MSAGMAADGGGSGSSGGHGGPCGACKFLRRKCVSGCIFAPYFDSEQGAAHFAAVHKVFGASNVSKLLLHIPAAKRLNAVVTICYEAQSRLRDPVYGCVGHIFTLQQQVLSLQSELSYLQAHLATMEVPTPPPSVHSNQMFSDMAMPIPVAYDQLSTLCDSSMAYPTSLSWTLHQRQQMQDPNIQFPDVASMTLETPTLDGVDLPKMARDLLNRHAPPLNCDRSLQQ